MQANVVTVVVAIAVVVGARESADIIRLLEKKCGFGGPSPMTCDKILILI